MKTALIIGSTGLVGAQLLNLILESPVYDKVVVFVKRETSIKHPKLIQHLIDFDKIENYQNLVVGDDFFCTIGTTIKKAGSREAFKKVDLIYPKQFAQIALKNKVSQFLIISSLGANEQSTNFYLKTKGEMEAFLKKLTFKSTIILRPSLLLGNRTEFRVGEKFGAIFMKTISILLFGKLQKYKPIESKTVAKALFELAQQNQDGFKIYESNEIQNF
ncbi:MAG TPA: NAD(P)H-binding protein [Flavobacterium sp.]|nr:NAD(P)H-binding protein [Flavobacterium sp.]